MADPGCKVYQGSDWDLKINGGIFSEDMPVISEFTLWGLGEPRKKMGKDVIQPPNK